MIFWRNRNDRVGKRDFNAIAVTSVDVAINGASGRGSLEGRSMVRCSTET